MADRLLSDWLKSYQQYTSSLESASLYSAWAGVVAISSVLQRKCYIEWEFGEATYPNIYVVLVGPPGCRKGTALAPVAKMLKDLGVPLAADSGSRQALIRKLIRSSQSVMLPGSTTDPGNTKMMVHCSLTIFSRELSVFIGKDNFDLLQTLCDWYDCPDPWIYETVARDEEAIYGICVTLFGATTPDMIKLTLTKEAIGGGFPSRVVFVYADRNAKANPWPFMTDVERRLQESLLRDLESIASLSGRFSVTESFADLWIPWYLKTAEEPVFKQGMLTYYNTRRPKNLLKLCMVMSACRANDMLITGEDFKRALELLAATEVHMPKVFSGIGANPNADLLQRVGQTIAANKQISVARLLQLYHNDADREMLASVLGTLEKMHFCRIEINGRDSMAIFTGKDMEL